MKRMVFLQALLFMPWMVAAQVPQSGSLVTILGTNTMFSAEELSAGPSEMAIKAAQERLPEEQLSSWRECYGLHVLIATIQDTLLQKYIQDNHLEATEEEIADFIRISHEPPPQFGMSLADMPDLSEDERLEAEAHAKAEISLWKLHKSLYKQYGGRIAKTTLGTFAMEALYAYIRECEQKELFTVHDASLRELFWQCFTNHTYTYYPPDQGEAALYEHPAETFKRQMLEMMEERNLLRERDPKPSATSDASPAARSQAGAPIEQGGGSPVP